MWMDSLPPAPRRCLELAHTALLAGRLPVGAVLAGPDGTLVGQGHNEVAGGASALAGSPLAHAEMVAIWRSGTPAFGELTLWTSVQPCAMCAGAAGFLGIGTVVHLAADPSAPAQNTPPPVASQLYADGAWSRVATLLFLLGTSERVRAAALDRDAVDWVRSGRADVLRSPSLAEGVELLTA